VHRRTVRQALDSALPPPRKAYPRPAPAIGPWTEVIDSWLEYERVPRKQRHTARRAWHSSHGKTPRDNSSLASVMRKILPLPRHWPWIRSYRGRRHL
jgi:hypothetical protein